MSEPERDIDVPADVRAGVWANDVDVFGDVEDVTLDFIRVEPRDAVQGSSSRVSRFRCPAYSS